MIFNGFNKNQNTAKKKDLNDKMRRLQEAKEELLLEYIKSNTDMSPLGRKVECYREDGNKPCYYGVGYVAGFNLDNIYDDVVYAINKVKKNGDMSTQSAGFYRVTRVVPIEEDNNNTK